MQANGSSAVQQCGNIGAWRADRMGAVGDDLTTSNCRGGLMLVRVSIT